MGAKKEVFIGLSKKADTDGQWETLTLTEHTCDGRVEINFPLTNKWRLWLIEEMSRNVIPATTTGRQAKL